MTQKFSYFFGTIFLVLFIALAAIVSFCYTHAPIPGLDPGIMNWAYHLQGNSFLVSASSIFAKLLGDTGGAVVGLIIFLLLFFLFKNRVGAIWLALTAVVGVGVNTGIKALIGRARPDTHRIAAFAHEPGASFASGHSLFATLLFGCLFLIIIQKVHSGAALFILGLIALLLIFFTMFSRVFLGVHYPSDTLGGFLEGLTFLALSYPTFLHYQERFSK